MSKLSHIAGHLQVELRRTRWLSDLQEELERLGGLQHAMDEGEKALDDLTSKIVEQEKVNAEAERILKQADEKASKIIADAMSKASEVDEASRKILHDAEVAAEVSRKEANNHIKMVEEAKAELAKFNEKLLRARQAAKQLMEG